MREVFERVVERCLASGIARTDHVAVDGSFIRADAGYARQVASAQDLSREDAPRAVREYFAKLETAAPDPDGVTRSTPKAKSLTDPGAALSIKHGPSAFAWGMNAMVDTASGIVLAVQAAPERFADEPVAARRMVERRLERHGATPDVLPAVTAYGSGPFLAWLDARKIEAHIPLIEHRHQTSGVLTQDAFVYEEASDTYTCPQGAVLKRYSRNEEAQRTVPYSVIAGRARSSGAARRARCGIFIVLPMRPSASRFALAGGPRLSSAPCVFESASSTCSPASSIMTDYGVCACEDSVALTSSSSLLRPLEFLGGSSGGLRIRSCRSPRSEHKRTPSRQ